jgi:hypothetical protein
LPINDLTLATSWPELDDLVERLADAVESNPALAADDWTRVLLLTEFTWASSLVGAGPDFAAASRIADPQALTVPRSLQRKLRRHAGADAALLYPGARRRTQIDET